jgi:hypothetical protein
MSFDIHDLHIEPDSPEGRGLQAIISRDHVTAEEAVRRVLRDAGTKQNPAQRMIGLFSSDEDAAMMDDVMQLSRESRTTETTRDIGL